jgi:hypothetical protein
MLGLIASAVKSVGRRDVIEVPIGTPARRQTSSMVVKVFSARDAAMRS